MKRRTQPGQILGTTLAILIAAAFIVLAVAGEVACLYMKARIVKEAVLP